MRSPLLSAAMAVAFAGCSAPGFAQLGEFQLRFRDGSSGFADALLDYDSQAEGCHTLDDFRAVVNGEPAGVTLGGSESGLFQPSSCRFPNISFTRPSLLSESVVIVASSGRDEVAVQVDGVGEHMTGVPLVRPGEMIHVGQRIQIALAPGFERVSWPAFGGVYLEGFGGPTTVDLAPPSAGGLLDVQLPSDLPPGEQHVLVNLTVTPGFTRCEGAPRGCRWDSTLVLKAVLDVPFQVSP